MLELKTRNCLRVYARSIDYFEILAMLSLYMYTGFVFPHIGRHIGRGI